MTVHDFDERGICRSCGRKRILEERKNTPCDGDARDRARAAAVAGHCKKRARVEAERAAARRLWRSEISWRRKLAVFALAHAAAMVGAVIGAMIYWGGVGWSLRIDSAYAGESYIGPGFHPGAKWWLLAWLLQMVGGFVAMIPVWAAAGVYTIFGRFFGAVSVSIGGAALWWISESYFVRSVLDGGGPPAAATFGGVFLALVWVVSGFWSIFRDLMELYGRSTSWTSPESLPFAVHFGGFFWDDLNVFWSKGQS